MQDETPMTSNKPLLAKLPDFGVQLLSGADLEGRNPGWDAANLGASVAVCPKTLDEVMAIVAWCAKTATPIVPHGGRTGLSGGAVSAPDQLVIMLDQMNTIREIDTKTNVAVVDAGVTLAQLEDAVSPLGLTVGIDLAARGSCTIGGMVATNAGGGEAFRNGVMRQRVLGLEAVLPDGTALNDLKKVIKSNEGYDAKQLLIGSEGSLGIVTGVVLKLEKAARNRKTVLASTKNATSALTYYRRLREAFGGKLLSAEIMWHGYFATTCKELGVKHRLGLAKGETYILTDLDIPQDDEAFLSVLAQSLETSEILDAVLAKNAAESSQIWQVREDSFLIDKAYPGGCWFDVSVPQSKLHSFVQESTARIHAIDPDLLVFLMGHMGDGNLHYTIAKEGGPVSHLYDDLASALYEGLHDIGGSFSAEHGIGTEKLGSLEKFCDPGKLALMRTLKAAIDPQNIMNPGKVLAPQIKPDE